MATKARHLKTPLQLWIADNRKRLHETPGDLARLTGVTEDTARGWESRGKPSEDALAVLVRHFGVAAPDAVEPMTGDVAGAIREQAASNDRLAEAMQAQADAFTTLAASIDRASTGVVGTVGGFDELLRGLLVALRAPDSGAPAGAQSAGPHARAER